MYADHVLSPWIEALPDVDFFDAHTHTGANDPDGYGVSAEQLLEALAVVNARAVVFTMHEPDGYPEANDRILAEAEASGGRLGKARGKSHFTMAPIQPDMASSISVNGSRPARERAGTWNE